MWTGIDMPKTRDHDLLKGEAVFHIQDVYGFLHLSSCQEEGSQSRKIISWDPKSVAGPGLGVVTLLKLETRAANANWN